ncbi:MAG: permease-like cell division protein FtsX [Patescibacteria group bacterium]
MFFLSIARILRFAFQSFLRNIWLSIVTITIIVLTVLSLTILILINVMADQAVTSIKQQVDISLYFEAGTSADQVLLVEDQINKIQHVKHVDYISSDSALKKFSETHSDNELILNALNEIGDNPLGPVLIVKADDINNYPLILQSIKDFQIDELTKEIDYDDHKIIMDRIEIISQKVKQFSLILSIVFAVISLLVVFNTIRIGIYVHRDEIGIMKLVGASNWFVRGPFLVETVLYAMFGCLIFWILFYLLVGFINPLVAGFFAEIDFSMVDYLLKNFFFIFGFEFLVILILNVISSLLAMNKYLRV